MNDKRDFTAIIITICAVITAMPRWIGALLASEGFAVPEDWRPWWIVASAIFNAAMAITEGVAFAYVFNAWRNQRDRNSDKLFWLALASGLVFIIVLAPFIAAQTRASGTPLSAMLSNDYALWLWSSAVAASTIVIVASVGYAQKRNGPEAASKVKVISEIKPAIQPAIIPVASFLCQHCPAEFATLQALNAHQRAHAGKAAVNGSGKLEQ
jgi:hypothetical protein